MVSAAAGFAIAAVLLFATAAALLYGYLSSASLDNFTASDVGVFGILAVIAAIGFYVARDRFSGH